MMLQKKIALVTGAGHGIGRTIALELARAGAKVVVNYPFERVEATELVSEISSFGGEAIAVRADVSKASERERMFERTKRQFGGLDILVNNAALDPGKFDFFDVDEDLFDQVTSVNLKGMFFCAQAAAKLMVEAGGGGRIINVSSIQGHQNLPGFSPYSMTKGGVNAMTRQLAMDLGPKRITVNAIAPGFIEVARTMALSEHYSRDDVAAEIPIGRVGFPRDIASLVCYLASEQSSFITGEVLVCDGGTSARLAL
jgi:glucose 1-dehydrogenase